MTYPECEGAGCSCGNDAALRFIKYPHTSILGGAGFGIVSGGVGKLWAFHLTEEQADQLLTRLEAGERFPLPIRGTSRVDDLGAPKRWLDWSEIQGGDNAAAP